MEHRDLRNLEYSAKKFKTFITTMRHLMKHLKIKTAKMAKTTTMSSLIPTVKSCMSPTTRLSKISMNSTQTLP